MITNNARRPAATAADVTLRTRGLRLTRPRWLILEVVRSTDAHPTAAFVYRRVRRRLPRVSLATVYRNLRRLAAEGFLVERPDPAGMRFDGNTAAHDHFTCVRCQRIFDLPRPATDRGRRHPALRPGFEVLDRRIEFFGRCEACRRRAPRLSVTSQRRSHVRQGSERN
jgi:Fe2+ or Zn2+ uptake regulation protein